MLSQALRQLGYAIWYAGAIGEILALQVLYRRYEQPGARLTVFLCTALLVLVVAAGPYRAYIKTGREMNRRSLSSSPQIDKTDNVIKADSAVINISDENRPSFDELSANKITDPTPETSGLGWPETS